MNVLLLCLILLVAFAINNASSYNNYDSNPNTHVKPSPDLPQHLIDESYNDVRLHPDHLAETEMYAPPGVHPLLPIEEIRGDREVMEEFNEMWLTDEGTTVTHAEIDDAIASGDAQITNNTVLQTPAFSMEIPQLYQMYCRRYRKYWGAWQWYHRLSRFTTNLLKIVRHNALAPEDARLGQTRTLDMDDDEFKSTHAGLILPKDLESRWDAAAREHHRAERLGAELNEFGHSNSSEDTVEKVLAEKPAPLSDNAVIVSAPARNKPDSTTEEVSKCNQVGGYCTTHTKCIATKGTPITGKCFSLDEEVSCCVPVQLTPVDPAKRTSRSASSSNPTASRSISKPSVVTDDVLYKNWVEEGVVNPIRNQQDCGACYSFAAISTIESQIAIETGKLYEFSEQQAVDCSRKFGNLGCVGGWYGQVFDYIIAKEDKDNHNHGVSVRKVYPYINKQGKCAERLAITHDSPAYITGYQYLPAKNVNAIMEALDKAPLTAALYSLCPEFRFYTSGIIQDLTNECVGHQVDHAVNLVGYGTSEDGIDYWIIRNSWDQTYGLDGYAKIERGRDVLGIESHVAVLNIDFEA